MTWKFWIEESLKASKLNDDIALDREKMNRTLKNTFIGREKTLLSENS